MSTALRRALFATLLLSLAGLGTACDPDADLPLPQDDATGPSPGETADTWSGTGADAATGGADAATGADAESYDYELIQLGNGPETTDPEPPETSDPDPDPTEEADPEPPEDTPAPGSLCASCSGHDDCGGQNDLCLQNGQTGDVFCGQLCFGNSECPSGYECADLGSFGQCVPSSGVCGNAGPHPDPVEPGGEGGTGSGDPTGETGPMAGMTAAHNAVRDATNAGLPALDWDPAIEAFAREWADELARNGCNIQHRPHSGEFAQQYGENIYWSRGFEPTAQQVVDAWASELRYYDYASNSCSGVCGHYTQIVWRDTVRLGCARSTCGDEEVWVCNYDPPGNYVGRRPY